MSLRGKDKSKFGANNYTLHAHSIKSAYGHRTKLRKKNKKWRVNI